MIWKLNKELLPEALAKSGAHEAGIAIFQKKTEIIPLQLAKVRTPAANILKQELLACGGDAVTPAGTVTGKDEYVDIILLGTLRQYEILCAKLLQMPFFGLDKWKCEIQNILQEQQIQTVLANGKVLNYSKTLIMGIINVTPDSFFEHSRVTEYDVLQRAERLLDEGADILDMGGESTRPNSQPISAGIEQQRLLPMLKAVREKFDGAIISIDTYHGDTAKKALDMGADIINDVSGGADTTLINVVKKNKAPLVLTYNGTGNIKQATETLLQKSEQFGLGKDKIIFDPGIGFGKTVAENLGIIRDSDVLINYGYPVLLGASRKSVIGAVLDLPPEERLTGTLAISVKSVLNGVNILRVHDVLENVRAVRMAEALK